MKLFSTKNASEEIRSRSLLFHNPNLSQVLHCTYIYTCSVFPYCNLAKQILKASPLLCLSVQFQHITKQKTISTKPADVSIYTCLCNLKI